MTPTTSFLVLDRDQDGLGDYIYGGVPLPVGRTVGEEYTALYEFNLTNLSLPSNTVITSAIFQVSVNSIEFAGLYFRLHAHGYIGNGQGNVSDYEAGEYLDGKYFLFIMEREPVELLTLMYSHLLIRKLETTILLLGLTFAPRRQTVTRMRRVLSALIRTPV